MKIPHFDVVKTNIIKMEYVELPIIDLSFRFLYRFVEPVSTVWTMGQVVMKLNFGKLHDYSYPNNKEVLKEFAMDQWHKNIMDAVQEGQELHKEAMWLIEMKDVDVVRCEILPVELEIGKK